MNIPDRWIADMQLVGRVIHLELHVIAETPEIGTVLVTGRFGTWQTLAIVEAATPVRGTIVAVKLIQPAPPSPR